MSFLDDSLVEYLKDPPADPHPLIERYLHGTCHIFAIALSRLTGFKIVGLLAPRTVEENGKVINGIGLIHAFCLVPKTHDIFDAKGIRECDRLKKEYPITLDSIISIMTEQELLLKCEPVDQTPELMQAIEEDVSITTEFIIVHYQEFIKNEIPR